jgi:CRP/FNR family transcriptional regulator, cyclic AMP receptor protein
VAGDIERDQVSPPIGAGCTFHVVSRSKLVSLLEIEPDLAGVLSDEQRAEVRRFWLPVADVDKGGDVAGLLEESGAFGAIVLEGMLVQDLQISKDPTLRLIGPGSFAPPPGGGFRSMPVLGARLFVPVPTRLVLLGDQVLIAARRWPWIVSFMHARMLEHSEHLATQLAICQLPRVEDRLIALMWLLAEFWGRVTPTGVKVPVSLSHEVLGGLVGARRPTVTLAVSKLAERGSLIRQGDGWLILEPPPAPLSTEPKAPRLLLTAAGGSAWAPHDPEEQRPEELQMLIQHLAQASKEHALDQIRRAREQTRDAKTMRERAQRFRTDPEHG